MLRILREGQRWLTGLFVVFVGGIFVLFFGFQGPFKGPVGGSLIQVGSYQFGRAEFERERERREAQYQEALGSLENVDQKVISDTLDDLATRALVDRALLALEAQALGMRVAKREIEQAVLADPGFRRGGRFDRELFEGFAEYEYGSQRNFMRDRQLTLLSLKMLRMLLDQAHVSEGEAREAARQRLEEARIAFVALDTAAVAADAEVAPEALAAFFPEREEEARTLYSQRSNVYDVPEQVRARHVLVRVEADATPEAEAEARAKADAILERLRGGEDFAAVAGEVSDDPGSQGSGGDLGFVHRGQMVPAFEEVAFSLEPGVLSDVVRSDYGFHVIRVEERKEAHHQPFEEVKEELAREILAAEAAAAEARALADRLAEGVRDGRSLEAVAREAELTLERSGWLKRRPDGFVPGLGGAPGLLAAAFALEPGESSPEIYEVGDKLALVQVLEHRQPEPADVEAAAAEERERLFQAKREVLTSAWLNARRSALYERGELKVDLSALRERS